MKNWLGASFQFLMGCAILIQRGALAGYRSFQAGLKASSDERIAGSVGDADILSSSVVTIQRFPSLAGKSWRGSLEGLRGVGQRLRYRRIQKASGHDAWQIRLILASLPMFADQIILILGLISHNIHNKWVFYINKLVIMEDEFQH